MTTMEHARMNVEVTMAKDFALRRQPADFLVAQKWLFQIYRLRVLVRSTNAA